MKSPLLLFLGLSTATHVSLLALHDGSPTAPRSGHQIQVSLLAGERRTSIAAESASTHTGNAAETRRSRSTNDPGGNHASGGDAPGFDNAAIASAASIRQSAVTPVSGERIRRELSRLLAAEFEYPPLALRLGHEGKVLVKVSILADGSIESAELAGSSGHRTLDLAAIDSVLAIKRAPQLRQWLQGRSLSINVPVSYRLIEA